ncbi:MAG: hypothetical protein KatS3mg125_2116 [Lysobacterales bacterium]|nr:MAG: hypothetical protein KatS3mg125_2116 [Xanthomonadales bacterium]
MVPDGNREASGATVGMDYSKVLPIGFAITTLTPVLLGLVWLVTFWIEVQAIRKATAEKALASAAVSESGGGERTVEGDSFGHKAEIGVPVRNVGSGVTTPRHGTAKGEGGVPVAGHQQNKGGEYERSSVVRFPMAEKGPAQGAGEASRLPHAAALEKDQQAKRTGGGRKLGILAYGARDWTATAVESLEQAGRDQGWTVIALEVEDQMNAPDFGRLTARYRSEVDFLAILTAQGEGLPGNRKGNFRIEVLRMPSGERMGAGWFMRIDEQRLEGNAVPVSRYRDIAAQVFGLLGRNSG